MHAAGGGDASESNDSKSNPWRASRRTRAWSRIRRRVSLSPGTQYKKAIRSSLGSSFQQLHLLAVPCLACPFRLAAVAANHLQPITSTQSLC
jgi:hypothetical protein